MQTDAHYDSETKTRNQITAQQKALLRCPTKQMGAGAGGSDAFAIPI